MVFPYCLFCFRLATDTTGSWGWPLGMCSRCLCLLRLGPWYRLWIIVRMRAKTSCMLGKPSATWLTFSVNFATPWNPAVSHLSINVMLVKLILTCMLGLNLAMSQSQCAQYSIHSIVYVRIESIKNQESDKFLKKELNLAIIQYHCAQYSIGQLYAFQFIHQIHF